MGANEVRELFEALKKNIALKRLDLSYNNIGDEGARLLAEALKTNTALISFNLDGNEIGPESARLLAVALEKNTALISLNLRFNNIGAEGAERLAAALEKNTALEALDLRNNNIGAEGAEHLIKLLERSPFLQEVNLSNNSVSQQQLLEIENLLVENIWIVPKIAHKIIVAGWEVVPKGENPKEKGVKLTAEEMEFITNPRSDAKVARYIEKITEEKQTEKNLTVTTTFTSRLLKAMKENHEQNSNKNTKNPHELSSDEKEKKEQDLVIPRGTLRKYYTLLSTLPFESLPKEVQDLAENFNLAKALQALGVTRKDVSKEVVETNSRSKKLLTELPRELLLQVLEYLGPRPLKYPLKKPLLKDSISTPTAAAEEEAATTTETATSNSISAAEANSISTATAAAVELHEKEEDEKAVYAEESVTTAAPALTSTTAAAPKDGASIANSSTTNSSETRQPEANQPMARQPETRTEAPSTSIISRYFCNCLSGIFNRRNNEAGNQQNRRG